MPTPVYGMIFPGAGFAIVPIYNISWMTRGNNAPDPTDVLAALMNDPGISVYPGIYRMTLKFINDFRRIPRFESGINLSCFLGL
ncbi:MAG: hypothetical protein ACQETR_15875 [Thermodesulfobacteriota bacterium]